MLPVRDATDCINRSADCMHRSTDCITESMPSPVIYRSVSRPYVPPRTDDARTDECITANDESRLFTFVEHRFIFVAANTSAGQLTALMPGT